MICATPIGNLGDASPRLAEALRSADVVYAEDTRRTAVLLRHLGVSPTVRSFFVGNEQDRAAELGERLAGGDTVALVTDAGTPGVADPGVSAVRAAQECGAVVTIVPGPSAVTAAIAVAGFASDRFAFEGFLPRKGALRAHRLEQLAAEDRTIVLFSATRRAGEDLEALAAALGAERRVVVARELTKVHEEVWRGTLAAAAEHWSGEERRGEFTIVVAPRPPGAPSLDQALLAVTAAVESGASLSAAVRSVAEDLGVPRRALYEAALRGR
ncbi:MAG: 16S rRNA (cytidine(1402)-2'-O)-methyltransferase [Actinobacteria bacterium]|nr:MAG: 16S rRNA (cytidine(1402)-2'-O)-methyltransferase [Actinomycetota bacterium]